MNRQDSLNALDLYDDIAIDKKIKPITAVESRSLVDDRNGDLFLDSDSVLEEFIGGAPSVC